MKKSKVTGMVGTAVLHVLVVLLLFSLTLVRPEPQEEGGVPVMLGETALAAGGADPYELTEVDVVTQLESEMPRPEVEDALITQTDEPSVQIKKEEPKKEQTEEEKAGQPEVREKTEAEKRGGYHCGKSGGKGCRNQHQQANQYGKPCIATCG